MHSLPLYPLHAESDCLLRHCLLPIHVGRAALGGQLDLDPRHPLGILHKHANHDAPALSDVTFDASFLMTLSGRCLIFLQGPSDFRLQRDFGTDLVVSGETNEVPFLLRCSEVFVGAEGEGPGERRWAIAKPVNGPAELSYGKTRPIAQIQVLINNFNFETGNEPQDSGNLDILRICAAGKTIDFVRREGYEQIKTLLKTDAVGSAPLLSFLFDAWDDCNETELAEFAFRVAGLCGLVAGQHTGTPVISFLDSDGRPIKRLLISNLLESQFREGYVLQNLQLKRGLPQLFEQCFDNYRVMHESERWSTVPVYCRSIDDPQYLEQRYSSLMAGVELLMRNSLIDSNISTSKAVEKLTLVELISAVKKHLGWDIPKHYTAKERMRLLRNAVSHGGPLSESPKQVRSELDKWALFLRRRVLMQLGFTGSIRSPNIKAGLWQESLVDDFSEDHNSF